MNKLSLFFIGLTITLPTLQSCSDDEETLTPSVPDINYFEVDPSLTDAESKLRRDFFEETGIYLLFNDTIWSGKDIFGNDHVEIVDFEWDLSNYGSEEYRSTYMTDIADKIEAAEMIKKYYLPYINYEGSPYKPFSLLIFNTLEVYDWGWKVPAFMQSFRTTAMPGQAWLGLDDEEAKKHTKTILSDIVTSTLSTYDEELEDFLAVSDKYYDAWYISEIFPEWIDEQDIELIYEAGFLHYYPDGFDPYYDSFPNEKNDFKKYVAAVFQEPEDEFREKWADYPLIIQKYNIIKEVIINLGIKLNIENQ